MLRWFHFSLHWTIPFLSDMDESVIVDLISLLKWLVLIFLLILRDPQAQVRQQAAEYVCGLTSTEDGCNMIYKKQGHLALTKLLGDNIVWLYYCFSLQAISKSAITALVNMCGNAAVLTDMANDELVDKLMENLRVIALLRVNLRKIIIHL